MCELYIVTCPVTFSCIVAIRIPCCSCQTNYFTNNKACNLSKVYYVQKHIYTYTHTHGVVLCKILNACRGCLLLLGFFFYSFSNTFMQYLQFFLPLAVVTKDEWTLVFRGQKEIGVQVWDTWSSAGVSHDSPIPADFPHACLRTDHYSTCDRHFRSHILDNWVNIQEVCNE